jgi:hypothetical protein
MEKQLDGLSLDSSSEHADAIRRMLSLGLYRYLKFPIPACIAEDEADATVVRRWHGEAVQEGAERVYKVQGSMWCYEVLDFTVPIIITDV